MEIPKQFQKSDVCDLVEIFTNGSQLNPEFNQKLVDSGLQRINISVEGLTAESYKRVADYNIDYNSFVESIQDLYDRKDSTLSMSSSSKERKSRIKE